MYEIGGRLRKEKEEKAKRDKELAKVVIRKEDVDIIVHETRSMVSQNALMIFFF